MMVAKEWINTALFIGYAFIHVFYISPVVNSYFHGLFASWGIALIIAGIWGMLAKMVLFKPIFSFSKYKLENLILVLVGVLFIVFDIAKLMPF